MNKKEADQGSMTAAELTAAHLQSKKSDAKKGKEKENLDRAERLKDELNRVFGQDISAEKLAEKLDIPLGTARGLLYKGSMTSVHKAEVYAKKLGIDVTYWVMGIRLTLDPARLADCLTLVQKVIAERPNEVFDLAQTSYMVSLVYNSSTTVCESVLGQTLDLLSQTKN